MPVTQEETKRRVEQWSVSLRDAGLRLTHQRLEVLREIAGTDEHPDVESIYQSVRRRVPTISLDTVYRTLATLADQGMVVRVAATSGAVRYDANTSHHHHYVCTQCGMVRDVVDPALDAVAPPASASEMGSVDSVEVQLRGVCTECALSNVRATRGALT